MANLTYAQLKGLWLAASQGTSYHTNGWASLMAAIAMAESGGNPNALNPTDNNGTQSSFGLWQISNGTHAAPSSNWADPATNAQLAIGKLNGQGLGAWGTYTSGAYKAYLNNSTTPSSSIPGNTGAISAQAGATAAQDCLMANPFGVTLPLVGKIGGSGCLFTYSNARAFVAVGVMLLGTVALVGGGSVIMLDVGLRVAGPLLGIATRTQAVGRSAARVAGVPARQAATRAPAPSPAPSRGLLAEAA